MILPALLLATFPQQAPVPDPKWGEDAHAPRGYCGFGQGLADIGDVDGDQLDDFTISDPEGSVPATIWIVSSRNGAVIESLCSDDDSRRFGRSISALPDIDGDGIGEILVGLAPDRDESAPGRAAVYSGRTRILLRTIDAPAGVRGFGARVVGLRDVDGDGAGDVLVASDPRNSEGYAFVHSGQTGRLLYRVHAPAGVEARCVEPVGDVDADGVADLAFAGFVTSAHAPLLRLHSGSDGHLLDELDAALLVQDDGQSDLVSCWGGVLQLPSSDPLRGAARVGDIDQDGVQDLVLGNPGAGLSGAVEAFSVGTRKILWRFDAPPTWRNLDLFRAGQAVVPIRDLDKDGLREFLWAPDNREGGGPGLVLVSSGKDGHLMRVFVRGPKLSLQCLGPKG